MVHIPQSYNASMAYTRVNKSGQFNVPFGKYTKPIIYQPENILAVSELLQRVHIIYGDYKQSEWYIARNTFVYLDPPYRPVNNTSFTKYDKSDFNDSDQSELAEFYR